jgi:ribonuclease HI
VTGRENWARDAADRLTQALVREGQLLAKRQRIDREVLRIHQTLLTDDWATYGEHLKLRNWPVNLQLPQIAMEQVEVFVDASGPMLDVAGIAVIAFHHKQVVAYGYTQISTPNTTMAEARALRAALTWLPEKSNLLIWCDNQSIVNAANNLLFEGESFATELARHTHVVVRKVKAHGDTIGNRLADHLARRGRLGK